MLYQWALLGEKMVREEWSVLVCVVSFLFVCPASPYFIRSGKARNAEIDRKASRPARVAKPKPCASFSSLLFFFAMWQHVLAQTVVTLAGGSTTGTASGSINGVGTAALFYQPHGVSVDGMGNVIVADRSSHKIRRISPDQSVITLAGGNSLGNTSGSTNGVGTAALFNQPTGVAVDTLGNVIVADWGNHKIRLIFPNYTVITLVGGDSSGTTLGSANGVGTAAFITLRTSPWMPRAT